MYFTGFLVYSVALLAVLACGIWMAWSDFKSMKIPNVLSLLIIIGFVVAFAADYFLIETNVFSLLRFHLLAGVIMFLITYALFAFGVFGAGDSKVITAFAFWVGLEGLPVFLIYVTLSGALLALLALGIRRLSVIPEMPEGSWLARLQAREAVVPYGIAISFGALVAFDRLGYFDFAALLRNMV